MSPKRSIGASGGFPISGPSLRLGELAATLVLAQDNAFGQPLESQLRSCLLAGWICDEAGVDYFFDKSTEFDCVPDLLKQLQLSLVGEH